MQKRSLIVIAFASFALAGCANRGATLGDDANQIVALCKGMSAENEVTLSAGNRVRCSSQPKGSLAAALARPPYGYGGYGSGYGSPYGYGGYGASIGAGFGFGFGGQGLLGGLAGQPGCTTRGPTGSRHVVPCF